MPRGRPKAGPEVLVLPIMHPAAILRGQWGHDPFQIVFLENARKVYEGEEKLLDIEQPLPGERVLRSIPEIEEYVRWAEAARPTLACDIETAGESLTCIGFCDIETEQPVVIPYRNSGMGYWFGARTPQVDQLVGRILANPEIRLVFQNGATFDIPMLERLGWRVEGYEDDTLIMHRNCYPEAPAALEFLGIVYGGLPAWKWLSSPDEGEGK